MIIPNDIINIILYWYDNMIDQKSILSEFERIQNSYDTVNYFSPEIRCIIMSYENYRFIIHHLSLFI